LRFHTANRVTATYTYGNALIRKDGETPLFDGLGSERTVTNASQSVTASLTLSAFGQTVASSGSSTSPYQFGATSGYRSEGDAGLTLVGCRFYDAQVGRFITRDTVLTEKPYAYCNGDPVNATDPSGHFSQGSFNGRVILGGVACLILVLAVPEVGIPLLLAVGAGSGAIGGIIGGRNDPGSTLSHAGWGAVGGIAIAAFMAIGRYAINYEDPADPTPPPPPDPPPGVWPPPPTGP